MGAGLLGFAINPPIALYYMQGLNTTPLHGHAALFGVYGLLALGLVLLALRRLVPAGEWRDRPLQVAYWGMNGGLALMIVLSLLPIGLIQAYASMEHGLWFARSAEFMQQPLIVALRWLRIVGDTVFAVGILALGWFVVGLVLAASAALISSPGQARPSAAALASGTSPRSRRAASSREPSSTTSATSATRRSARA